MFFKMDIRKAIEATAVLLRLTPNRAMDRKRLLAFLYLADRKSLERSGRPIVGGRMVAMPYGPIHSEVYDLIKGARDQAEWSRHFSNEGYRINLTDEIRVTFLSRFEIELLNEISSIYSGFDTWDVANETHEFAEYKKNYHDGTSTPISLEDLVSAVGRKSDQQAIVKDAAEKAYYDEMFAEKK